MFNLFCQQFWPDKNKTMHCCYTTSTSLDTAVVLLQTNLIDNLNVFCMTIPLYNKCNLTTGGKNLLEFRRSKTVWSSKSHPFW